MNENLINQILHPPLPSSDSASSPDSIYKEVHEVIAEVLEIFGSLTSEADLQPRKEVNDKFSNLVNLCIKPREKCVVSAVLSDASVQEVAPQLRELCSEGEAHLETFWAHRIIHAISGSIQGGVSNFWFSRIFFSWLFTYFIVEKDFLQSFPYYNNYVDLCRLEYATLTAVSLNEPQSIAFIGSGPLPLTSFCLADRLPNAQIHNIDNDSDAIEISSMLTRQLCYKNITFANENAYGGKSLMEFDVVYLAALVGRESEEKLRIIGDVASRMRAGAVLCLRSAHSLRELLYPVIQPSELWNGGISLEPLVDIHPWNHIVNSTLLMRVLASR
jgi:nicotianamine synthase